MMADLIWPLPKLADGRLPVISHEFERRLHLGVDVMFRWRDGDPSTAPFCAQDRKGRPAFVVPTDRVPVLAVAAGRVIYAKLAANGWRTRILVSSALHVLDLHMTKLFVRGGDHVSQGQPIGWCGGDPTDLPRQLLHDHHEHRRPAMPGEVSDGWGMTAYDPAAELARAAVLGPCDLTLPE